MEQNTQELLTNIRTLLERSKDQGLLLQQLLEILLPKEEPRDEESEVTEDTRL